MSVIEAERLRSEDRRRWPRAAVHLPLCIIDTEGDFRVLTGESVDVSVGGVLAVVDGPLAGALQATVRLELADGCALVCEARVAGGGAVDGGWQYRLAFVDLASDEVEALDQVVRCATL